MPALDTLHIRVEDFEGPLPLLLHLIERNELEIARVSVVAVADQFLSVVAQAGGSDLSIIGEFLATAARLLVIKSRALLTRNPVEADEAGHDDAAALMRQIAEYRRFQSAARWLGERRTGDFLALPRPAHPVMHEAPPRLPVVLPATLRRAAQRLLAPPAPVTPYVEVWPAVDYPALRAELLSELAVQQCLTLQQICRGTWHPLVMITFFLAMLDAIRAQLVDAQQDEAFGTITLSLRTEARRDA